jgi:lipopolysaccharide/colanic/teichoic acid biosynthesis glycosyltransferase
MAVLEHTGRVTQFDQVLGRSALIRHRSLHWALRYQHQLVVLVIKSFFDKIIATAALIAFSPILALIALAIVLDDGGPALFTQTRVGKVLFKMRQDPRITTIGSFLRRTSLDELPQLLNVMLGEMSLVGPRPALPAEAALYSDELCRRLDVKPGMTGLWQINGRSDLSYEDAVRLDLRYVENWTLALDLQILWKTCAAVANGRGAY